MYTSLFILKKAKFVNARIAKYEQLRYKQLVCFEKSILFCADVDVS